MKVKKIKKDFDSVDFFRNVKEQMAKKLYGKSFKEQKEILKKMQTDEFRNHNNPPELTSELVRDKKNK